MTYKKAKEIVKDLGLNGKSFSKLIGKRSTNYFSDMKKKGVTTNISIILAMIEKLNESEITNEEIIELISSNVQMSEEK